MATLTGTYVRTGLSTSDRVNGVIDYMLSPQIVEFRQIIIHHEKGTYVNNNTWKFTYNNWNPDFTTQVFLNNGINPLSETLYTINYDMGSITMNADITDGDNVQCTYSFDYFPIYILESYLYRAVDTINVGAVGPTTNYDINDAPGNWDGVIADIAFSMCMEKLILDYDLWKGRLIFAIGPQQVYEGAGGDIVSQLETLKRNAEERVDKALQNPKLKSSPTLAKPTQYYYESLLVGSSSRRSAHGLSDIGKLRGIRWNKYLGRILS